MDSFNPQWIIAFVAILSLFLNCFLAYRTIQLIQKSHPYYECDSQFFEISKILLQEPKLYTFYSYDEGKHKDWNKRSEDEQRLYLFSEMYYFHLAFVYREFVENRIDFKYWQLVERFLMKLIMYSPTFMEVHENEGIHYEGEFKKKVDEIVDSLRKDKLWGTEFKKAK